MKSAYEKEIEAYKKFRDEKLLIERNFIKKMIEGINLEIQDYERLKEKSIDLGVKSTDTDTQSLKIPLDLGEGYSTDFEVFDKEFVLVSVGFGFYCRMTWNESEKFCSSRIEMLQRRKKRISDKIDKIEEHLKLTNEIISELSKQK